MDKKIQRAFEDVRGLSMREIRSRIAALSPQDDAESTGGASASPAPDAAGTQSGAGQGEQHRRGRNEA